MDHKSIRAKKGPEAIIQQQIIEFLKIRDWFVKVVTASDVMSGFPDMYATHYIHGPRWIEVKQPVKFSFTDAQYRDFPKFVAHGTRIWVLCAATEEEYAKLFKPQNLWVYMQRR